jgi:hypothetical protein
MRWPPRLELHQPHYQSLNYNSLNGGIPRDFAPIEPEISHNRVLTAALELYCTTFGRLAPYYAWHIEVHQCAFRDVLVITFRKR